jgi:hypothetical protein
MAGSNSEMLCVRVDPETRDLLEQLARRLATTRAAIVRLGIRRVAQAEGLPLPELAVTALEGQRGRPRGRRKSSE